MQVIGSAEEARSLSQNVWMKTKTIYGLAKDIAGQVKALQNSYRDAGFDELNEIVTKVYLSINEHIEDVNSLKTALDAYAEVLERRN